MKSIAVIAALAAVLAAVAAIISAIAAHKTWKHSIETTKAMLSMQLTGNLNLDKSGRTSNFDLL